MNETSFQNEDRFDERDMAASKETFLKTLRGDELQKSLSIDELGDILDTTIKHDSMNKIITFLTMVLTYTEEDQQNVAYTAESSTGKSYIPLELVWYFPKEDVLEYGYTSPTAWYHKFGEWIPDPNDKRPDVSEEKRHKLTLVNLHQKIVVFLDQPHDMFLQRIRPLLSHDRKTLVLKITDRKETSGLRTKTMLIQGFPEYPSCTIY